MDMYVPLFTMLEFIFYFGWLKVSFVITNKNHIYVNFYSLTLSDFLYDSYRYFPI